MYRFALCLLFSLSVYCVAQDHPERIGPDIAARNLTKEVDPAIPPLAKAAGIGGTVTADVTVDVDGKVKSVTLISGHPMLAPAFVDAVKKWEYSPFLKDGKPVPVMTRVDWSFEGPTYSKVQEQAIRDYFPAFRICYDLVKQGKGAEAEPKCNEVLAMSAQLPPSRILERSDANVFLGHALFLQHKYAESLPLYEKAVEIRKPYEHSDRDADFASENASLARAYAALGNLVQADTCYSQAVTIFKTAIANLPEMKDNYTARLKSTLLEYAKLKAVLGQNDKASRLEMEAAQL